MYVHVGLGLGLGFCVNPTYRSGDMKYFLKSTTEL